MPLQASTIEILRRSIASHYSGCRNGDSCFHPTTETCACLEAAILAANAPPAIQQAHLLAAD